MWATANILPDGQIEIASDKIEMPASVCYRWAGNPVVNMYSQAGLPLTPFCTNDCPGVPIHNKCRD